jgi:hypothetical protein
MKMIKGVVYGRVGCFLQGWEDVGWEVNEQG